MNQKINSFSNYLRLLVAVGLFAVPSGALRASCCYSGTSGEVCVMCVGSLCLFGGPGPGDIMVLDQTEALALEDLCSILNTTIVKK